MLLLSTRCAHAPRRFGDASTNPAILALGTGRPRLRETSRPPSVRARGRPARPRCAGRHRRDVPDGARGDACGRRRAPREAAEGRGGCAHPAGRVWSGWRRREPRCNGRERHSSVLPGLLAHEYNIGTTAPRQAIRRDSGGVGTAPGRPDAIALRRPGVNRASRAPHAPRSRTTRARSSTCRHVRNARGGARWPTTTASPPRPS